MPKQTVTDLDCELIHETEKAWLLDFGSDVPETWVPKSIGELDEKQNTITLPIRWATDKGLI